MKMSVNDLVDVALKARRAAQTAIATTVREARSAEWSWDEISAAPGGNPNGDALRRKFSLINSG